MTLNRIDELDSFLVELRDDDQIERERFLEKQGQRYEVIKAAVDLSKEILREREVFLEGEKQRMARLKEAIAQARKLDASEHQLAKMEVSELKVTAPRAVRRAKPRRRTSPTRASAAEAQGNDGAGTIEERIHDPQQVESESHRLAG